MSKKPSLPGKLFRVFIVFFCFLLLVSVGIAAYVYVDLSRAIKRNEAVDLGGRKLPEDYKGAFNVLIVGSDSGGGDPRYKRGGENLADVTILVHVSADRTHAEAVSIPRDTIVDIPQCTGANGISLAAQKKVRFNSSLFRGGLGCTVKTAELLTGLNIEYAALLQFNSVIGITETIGGVPVCLKGPIKDKYTGLDLPAGLHNISGQTALAFLRSRHSIGDGSDLSRIRSQQGFLSSMLRKIRKINFVAEPLKAYSIFRTILSNTTLSTSLNSLEKLGGMLLATLKVKPGNFVFLRYPTRVVGNVVYPVLQQAKALNEALLEDRPITLLGGKNNRLGVEITTPSAISETPSSPTKQTESIPATTSPIGVEIQSIGQTGEDESCVVPYGK